MKGEIVILSYRIVTVEQIEVKLAVSLDFARYFLGRTISALPGSLMFTVSYILAGLLPGKV